jgi:hypothetical protein
MSALLKALLPTHAALMDDSIHFFSVHYTWDDPVFGELAGHTVITGCDADAALKNFQSKHRHLTSATIIK